MRQAPSLIENGDAPIEAFVDVYRGFRVAATAGSGEELQAVRAEGDGVVVADDALVLEAEDRVRIESGRPWAIGRSGIGGRLRKARIETREEVGEIRVRALAVPDAREAEFAAEPILERAKEPLDAALGLRAVGGDPADTQFLQGACDLCGRGFPGQLLGEGQRSLGRGPVEDAMAIAVRGDGDALGLGEGVEDLEVAVRVFLIPKRGRGDFTGGVVLDGHQGEARAALLEPIVVAPVELHEQALLWHPLPAAAVAGRATVPRAAQPGRAQEAGDRLAGEAQAFVLGEEFTEMLEVRPRVRGLSEVEQAGADRVGDPAGRRAAAIPVDQGRWAPGAVRTAQSTDLPTGQPQQLSRLRHEKVPSVEGMQDLQLVFHSWRQSDHASLYSTQQGRTFSLSD